MQREITIISASDRVEDGWKVDWEPACDLHLTPDLVVGFLPIGPLPGTGCLGHDHRKRVHMP
jgi:hypothetical protein